MFRTEFPVPLHPTDFTLGIGSPKISRWGHAPDSVEQL
jgi:hypothetical protein